jgi:branched-chain amino acid transport system substrate-binding protein
MQRRNWRQPLGVTIALALALAACGDDDDSGAATTTTAAAAETTAAAVTETTGTEESTAPDEEATGDTEAGGGGKFGLIDGVYQGADGFVLDPADCPEDWDPMQGITDTDITFFTSMPKAGPLAGFGLVGDGIQSYFDYVNAQGGVDGHMLHLEIKDDGYVPDKTKSNVDEALGEAKYAGLLSVIGTPNNLAIWDTTNDECMPQLLNGTGAPQWGDVTNHPWTTGMGLNYASEAGLWVEWLKAEHPEAKTVAAVAFNNDFGKTYVDGFKRFIKGTDIQVVAQELHEPTAPDLTNQFTTLAATNADVVLIETSGVFCTQALSELERNTSWNPIVIMSGTCASLSQFFQPLIDQGLTGEGTNLIQYVKDVNDPAFADDEFVKLFHSTLKEQGLDSKQTTYATGWLFAWYMVEALKQAATYEGGLDRGNIALAAQYIDAQNPLVLDGITQSASAPTDAYLNEGGRMVVYTMGEDKSVLGTFVPVGELLDQNGGIGNYDDFVAGG